MKIKKLISTLLAAAMILSLLPSTVFAANAEDAVIPTVTWKMDETSVGQNSNGDKIYKLVGTINSPNGISSIMTSIDYDDTVIQPVLRANTYADVTLEYTTDGIDITTTTPIKGLLSTKDALGDSKAYSDQVVWRTTGTGRTNVDYTMYVTSAKATENNTEMDYMEFYFRFKEGKSIEDMDAETFVIRCLNESDPIAFSVTDANDNDWVYYPTGTNNTGSPELTPTITYPNHDKTVYKGVASVDGKDTGTAAEVRKALESTDTQEITLFKDINFESTRANVPAGANIKLNLNGHTITCSAAYTIYNNGTLTIDGGEGNQNTSIITNTSTYGSNSTDYATLYNYTGTLTLKNLTVSNTGVNSAVTNYYNVNTTPYTFATMSAENCTMISKAKYGLSTTGSVTKLSGCTIQTDGDAYALYASGLGHTSSGPYGVIGTIENTNIISTSASTTKPAMYLVGSMNYLNWNSASDCTVGTITGCTIKTNDSAQAPAIYLTTGAMIYSLTDSTVSGGTNAVEVVRYWYNGGITHLSATMTAHNGDVINVSGAGSSFQQQLVGIEGGKYKPSGDNYYIYNVEKGDNYFIWINTDGKLQKDSDGYYCVGTASDNTNYAVTFYGSDGNMYKAVSPVKTGTTLASVLGTTANPTKTDSKNILAYTFEGWALTEGGTEVVPDDYQITGNTDFYPVYSEKVVGDVAIKLTMRHPFSSESDLAYVANLEGYYSSFGAAYQVYNSNTLYANYVLTLQKDVVATAATSTENAAGIYYGSVWCSAEKELTIDLAGHTLTMNAPMKVCWPGTQWVDQIALTITDSVGGGKLKLADDCTTASNGVIYAYQTARIKIDGNLTVENPNGPVIVVNSGEKYQSDSSYWKDESIVSIGDGAKLVGSTNGIELVAGNLNGHIIPVTIDGATIDGQSGYAITADNTTSSDMAITLASGKLVGTSGALNVNNDKVTWQNSAGKTTSLSEEGNIQVTYNVTFQNGKDKVATTSVGEGKTATAPGTAPTKEGYTFKGWSTKENGTADDVNLATTKITADTTFYAVFEINKYTVTFKNGENVVDTQTINHGSKATAPTTNPTKTGYLFTGWSTEENGKTVDVSNTAITGTTTFYAVFSENYYTVTFMNGENTVTTEQALQGGAVEIPATTPYKAGDTFTFYLFTGWSTTKDGTNLVEFPYTPTAKEITLYAVYEKQTYVTATVGSNGSAEVKELPVEDNAPITITATTDSKDSGTAAISIDKGIVDKISENKTTELTVKTDVADVTFDQTALEKISGDSGAKGNGIKLEAKKVEKTDLTLAQQNAIQSDSAVIIDLNLTDGNNGHVKFTGGKAQITVPFEIPSGKSAKNFAMFYIDDNGNKEKLKEYKFENGYVTFTTEHFSTFAGDEDTGYTMEAKVQGNTTNFNVGETVTVDIQAYADANATINSFQFTLNYDSEKLELENVTTTLDGTLKQEGSTSTTAFGIDSKTGISIPAVGDDIEDSGTPVTIATATFTVKSGIESGAETIGLTGAEMTTQGAASSKAPTVVSTTVNLYDIQVTLKTDDTGTINGESKDVTLYAKYNGTGLYSDTNRTTKVESLTVAPATGYRLADNNWSDGMKDYAAIAAKTFTESATYTLQTVQQFTVKFEAGDHGSLTANTEDQQLDINSQLTTWPTPTPDEGYILDGWYDGNTTVNAKDYTVTKNVTLTAKFKAETFNVAQTATNATITIVSGVTNDIATYGEAIKFKAEADENYVLTSVAYKIGDNNPVTMTAGEDGSYTLPGTAILGDVTITADATPYYTVTFKAGDGTLLNGASTDITAYVLSGYNTMYGSLADLTDNGASAFTIPTVTASSTDYRLPTGEEAVWKDGDNGGHIALDNLSVEKNIVLTAQAIRQYTVTFDAGTNGSLTDSENASIKVDAGKAWSAVTRPDVTPNPGYAFIEWTLNGNDSINDDVTATARYDFAKYKVNVPTNVSNVTVSATDGTSTTESGEIMATYKTNATFTVKVDTGAKVTKVTYQIGDGDPVDVVENENGIGDSYTFEIDGDKIIGAIDVNVVSNATYQVTFNAGENGTVDGKSSVTKTFDENHKITDDDLPEVVGNKGYQMDTWDTDPVGQDVTGETAYNVTFKEGTYNVTLPGSVSGPDSATYKSDLTFIPAASGEIITNVTAKIGNDSITVDKNPNGSYTIAGSQITGDITIEVTSVTGTLEEISYDDYAALESGTKIVVVRTAQLDDGNKYTMTGGVGDLYWSGKYNAYVAIVDKDLTEAQLASMLVRFEGATTEISYSGDINGSGTTTAADAGIVNDILHRVTLNYTPNAKMRLELDVSGDKKVTTTDIQTVLEKAVKLETTGTSTGSGGGSGSTATNSGAGIGGAGSATTITSE